MKKLILPTTQYITETNKLIRSKFPSGNTPYDPLDDLIDYVDKIIYFTPIDRSIIEIAAYYLKNIILLQSFVDFNHRTAIQITAEFLEDNGYMTKDLLNITQYSVYKKESMIKDYGDLYPELSEDILVEKDNYMYIDCLNFIKYKLIR
ncbi:MAG: hypothetical protein C00003105_00763 [ANME-2 cluster archaeon HR1]|jgi:hypothetical protein|nr:MAG: hypothetical protein C00003105_00763 [ANME-2 cluster archaeon HR1]